MKQQEISSTKVFKAREENTVRKIIEIAILVLVVVVLKRGIYDYYKKVIGN